MYPLIFTRAEGRGERSILTYQEFLIAFDERSQALVWHVGDEVVEQGSLPEQGMDAAFGGAGPQLRIHA